MDRQLIEIYEEKVLSHQSVVKWCLEFASGHIRMMDYERIGILTTAGSMRTKCMLKQQSGIAGEWLSVLEHDEGLSHRTMSRIIQELGFHKFMCDGFCEHYQKTTSCKEFVELSPSSNSMPSMVMISSNALSVVARCQFTVTPGDKMCKHGLPISQVPAMQIKLDQSACKVMAVMFWDCHGVWLVDFMGKATTVSAVT